MNDVSKRVAKINEEISKLKKRKSQLMPKTKEPLAPGRDVHAKVWTDEVARINKKIEEFRNKRGKLQAQQRQSR